LSDLHRRRNVEYLPGDDTGQLAFRVRTIETFSLSDVMFINADTMISLQIFNSESHPNSHMQGPTKSASGAKENLSVFGLFQHLAHTPQGRYKLRQIFLRPTLNIGLIEERQATIGVLSRPSNSTCLEKIVSSLKGIKNIRSVVVHLQKGISGASTTGSSIRRGVWASLQAFTYHVLRILEAVREIDDCQSLPLMQKV
jgi:DNA mismatch repair protein MSH5